jgi:hypothetical protein
MKQKRGQFFILAAVLIVSVVIGMALYVNQVYLQETPENIVSLRDELGEESRMVIDYGLYRGDDKVFGEFVEEMVKNIYQYRDSKLDLVFIYGNKTTLKVLNFGEDMNISVDNSKTLVPTSKTRSLPIGVGAGTGVNPNLEDIVPTLIPLGDNGNNQITFTINNVQHSMKMTPSLQNFYFVIKREEGEHIDVAVAN